MLPAMQSGGVSINSSNNDSRTVGQRAAANGGGRGGGGVGEMKEFVDVWVGNMDEAFACMRRIVKSYPYVAMVRGDAGRV